MPTFETLLIANRGEIACRIIRTARALGYRTVAVYSDADQDAPHVRMADLAVRIGPPEVGASYLNAAAIIDAAKATGAEAIHPGYGFLSENAAFAAACGKAGLFFVGPPPEAIRVMGNKAEAKRRMIAAGVPCVPGYEGEDQSDAGLIAAAREVGFPFMVKAAAGGGGRGMRLVAGEADLPAALDAARSEAKNAFGSDELILERAIERARHVEIQVFADGHGNVVHLFERDCSIQRRHQKVIEEAPSPAVSPKLRSAMGGAAVEAARAIDYLGAGTVEFLLDQSGQFYFLEMNTRLQVEHPVTEMITGQDLVACQLAVAAGEPLPFTQDTLAIDGHAIEARLYAEDPDNGFLPATGRLALWRPAEGDGVRVDAGIAQDQMVTPFYDPMIAKVIAHGPDRETARRRLIRALATTGVLGVVTNKRFLIDALRDPVFAACEATTAFLDDASTGAATDDDAGEHRLAALAAVLRHIRGHDGGPLRNWHSGRRGASSVRFGSDDLTVAAQAPDFVVTAGDRSFEIVIAGLDDGVVRFACDGVLQSGFFAYGEAHDVHVDAFGISKNFENALLSPKSAADGAADGHVVAPMHGRILRVFVAAGQAVEKGDRLMVLEAMKMEHEIAAPAAGAVADLAVKEGDQIAARAPLLTIDVG